MLTLPRLQFITHRTESHGLADSAALALDCGFRWIQFRCKENLPYEQIREEALKIQALCKQHHALFVVNDRVELAAEVGADGVHLGKSDMPVAQARQRLGKQFLIGGTANTWQDMQRIAEQGGDYIGLGPFRFTTTKENLSPVLGIEGYRNLMHLAKENHLDLPVFAIGGIVAQDAQALQESGVYGLALSSVLLHAAKPEKEAEIFMRYFSPIKNQHEYE